MFGIYDRGTSEVRIFFVDNNRTKETLLPIIHKNVYTYYNSIENNADPNDKYTLPEFSLTISRHIK